MQPLLLDTSFWDVVAWMVMFFFFVLVIWMFIAVFADVLRRRDIGGWTKAAWIFFIFALPLLGILFYVIFRPKPTEEEIHSMWGQDYGYGGTSGSYADEIAKAHDLLQKGAISQEEYDAIKRRTLPTSPASA